jgi:sterile alpha motif and leucine zipper-containing kinase AZK|eukprot:COSAG06_NODE_55_length_27705_cov_7.023402_4_plen_106_part_00
MHASLLTVVVPLVCLVSQEPATPASDVYSFGVLLLELATLTQPLYDLDQMAIMGQIGFGGRKLMDEIPADCDGRFADVIRQCLSPEPTERIEVPALVERMQELLL